MRIIEHSANAIHEALPNVFGNTKALTQVAALPYVVLRTGVEILLVTSRRKGHWLLPRGWPVDGMSYRLAAAREATEEAGLVGDIGDIALGDYLYKKRTDHGYRVPCRVFVYPLHVTEQRLEWPEKKERRQKWCDFQTARTLVQQKSLAAFLQSLDEASDLISRLDAHNSLSQRDKH